MLRILSLWILGIYVLCDGSEDQIKVRKIQIDSENKNDSPMWAGMTAGGGLWLVILCIKAPPIGLGIAVGAPLGAYTDILVGVQTDGEVVKESK